MSMGKVNIRKLKEEDVKDYLNLVHDGENFDKSIQEYTPGLCVNNEEEYQELLDDNTKRMWAVINELEQMVGVILLNNLFLGDTFEVGFFIGKEHRGNSYAAQSLALLIENLRNTKIKKLVFFVDKSNEYSMNIVDSKLGAKYDHDYEDNKEMHTLEI